MKPKLVFIIGEHIENLDDTQLTAPLHLEFFPELATRRLDGGVRYPQHANRTIAAARAIIDDFLKFNSYSVGVVTHCAHIVMYVGGLIGDGKLNADCVEIWMFDDESPSKAEPDKVFYFNDKGHLLDWPFGWFEPEL